MFRQGSDKATRLPQPKHDQVNGLLDKGCSFEGKLTFDGTVQINGDFTGEIYSDGALVIGAEAKVSAKVFVDTLVVYGKVTGMIEAKTRVQMHAPAVVAADIHTSSLSIEDGVVFNGNCQMDKGEMKVLGKEGKEEDRAERPEMGEEYQSGDDALVM